MAEPKQTQHEKIMNKPLPDILEELEGYIMQVEDAVKASQAAANESRAAAADARSAGEAAGAAAKKAAEAALVKLEKGFQDSFASITEQLQHLRDSIVETRKVADQALAIAQVMNQGVAAAVSAYNNELDKVR